MISEFRRLLNGLMADAPGGAINIVELGNRMGIPRSTIYRHIKGFPMREDMLQTYARALGDTPERQEQISREMRRVLGMPDPDRSPQTDGLRALVVEMEALDQESLDMVWQLVAMLRRANARQAPDTQGEAVLSPESSATEA